MRIADVELPSSAAIELALRLREKGNHGLAWHIEMAVDHAHDDLGSLLPRDRKALLKATRGCDGQLAELRRVLKAHAREAA